MKIAYERISAAKVFCKSINTELKQSLTAVFVHNSHKVLLLFGECVGESDTTVKIKRNFNSVASVRIISGVTVFETVNAESDFVRRFKICMISQGLYRDCYLFAGRENLGEYVIIMKFGFHFFLLIVLFQRFCPFHTICRCFQEAPQEQWHPPYPDLRESLCR